MGRWTQYDEDGARLPEGMKRIGYDADSRRYTFEDTTTGKLYESEPGNSYGVLRPIRSSANNPHSDAATLEFLRRAESVRERAKPFGPTNIQAFDDILPAHAIAAAPPPKESSSKSPLSLSSDSSGSRLPGIFRKVRALSSAVARMQQAEHSQPESPSGHHKSPSLPAYSTSRFRDSSPPAQLSRRKTGYSRITDSRQEEDKKGLLRSKTMSSVSSSSSRGSNHAPSRSTSRASRVSNLSTTSTITPMKTR